MLILTEGMSLLTTDSPHWVGASGRQMQRHTWPRCGALSILLRSSVLSLGCIGRNPAPLLCSAFQKFFWLMTCSLVHLFMGLRLEHLTQACLCIPKPFGQRKPLFCETLSPDLLDPGCAHCYPPAGIPASECLSHVCP